MSFKQLTVQRIEQKDCTVGIMNYGDFRCCTLELAWMNNTGFISCIPSGTYQCKKIVSPSLGVCVDIMGVVDREYIRIHAGNYTHQIRGCILVGDSIKDINKDGILDVTNSKNTLRKLMSALPESFQIVISRG